MRRTIALFACAVVLSSVAMCQDLPMREFAYHEGFEAGDDPVEFWVSNGEYEVNFKGVTDERAFEGERSFKLDVSLTSGSYFYWHVPVRLPAEGDLTFSARIYVDEGSNAKAGLGLNWFFPPTHHSGCGPFESYGEPTGEWKLIEADLGDVGVQRANGVMRGWVAGGGGEYVGVYVDRWGIFIGGRPGQRAVIYVDDVRIEGQVPEEEPYQALIAERWEPFEEAWSQRLTEWQGRLDAAEQRLADLPGLPEQLAAAEDAVTAAAERARQSVEALAGSGYARPQEVDALEGDLRMAELAPVTLERIAAAAAGDSPLAAFPVRAISNARILPSEFAVPMLDQEDVAISACRGEYETGSFVVLPLEDVSGLLVTPTDLTCAAGTIPADAVDVKLVKVWYQAGRGIHDLSGRILVPELLLNDDALVRVDEAAQHNYLRSTGVDGQEDYVLCSGEDSAVLEGVRPIDADTLQPLDLPAMRLQQYWVTLRVPEGAAAGEYAGTLQLSTADGAAAQIPLTVDVHEFDLAPSPLIYSVYYRAKLAEDNQPTITSEMRSEEQYLAEMRDMAAHSCLYPTIYQGYHEELLPRALELREEAGLPSDYLFTLGTSTGAPQTEAEIAALRSRVRDWLAMAERFGYEQMYIYGIDEARGERLAAQRAAWQAVHEEGAGTFVACYYATFEAMGDLLDIAVLAGGPDPEEAEKFHGVGSRAFTYAFPQVGPEEPETFRRNFGLVLWRANFDGAMDYAYQHGFGHVWNDFDSDRYRDHNFTYPTVNGVVDTVQWVGFREAADDTRYMATLLAAIEGAHAPAPAAAARDFVDGLDPQRDLYEVRAEMVAHIRRCLGLGGGGPHP